MAQKGGAWESHPLSIFKSMKLASTLQKSARFSKHLFRKVHSSHSQNRKLAAKCYIIASVWGMLYPFFLLYPSFSSHYIFLHLRSYCGRPLSYTVTSDVEEQQEVRDWRVGGRQKNSQLQVIANVRLQNLPLRSEVSPTHPQMYLYASPTMQLIVSCFTLTHVL